MESQKKIKVSITKARFIILFVFSLIILNGCDLDFDLDFGEGTGLGTTLESIISNPIVVQQSDTFPFSSANSPLPDIEFKIIWEAKGDPGYFTVIVSNSECNPDSNSPTEPENVPDCPQIRWDNQGGTSFLGGISISGLPGGQSWSKYDIVIKYCVESGGGKGCMIYQEYWNLADFQASSESWESIQLDPIL